MQPNIAHYFLLSCQKFPNQPAIIIDEETYTYYELFAYTKSVYSFLEKQHIQNKRIGLFCQNDILLIFLRLYVKSINRNLIGKIYIRHIKKN